MRHSGAPCLAAYGMFQLKPFGPIALAFARTFAALEKVGNKQRGRSLGHLSLKTFQQTKKIKNFSLEQEIAHKIAYRILIDQRTQKANESGIVSCLMHRMMLGKLEMHSVHCTQSFTVEDPSLQIGRLRKGQVHIAEIKDL